MARDDYGLKIVVERGGAPTGPGFYWAKWKIKDPGTAEEDDPPFGKIWEVVDVFVNCINPEDDEHLMVAVTGVEKAQSLENFFWGPGPLHAPSDYRAMGMSWLEIAELLERSKPSVVGKAKRLGMTDWNVN